MQQQMGQILRKSYIGNRYRKSDTKVYEPYPPQHLACWTQARYILYKRFLIPFTMQNILFGGGCVITKIELENMSKAEIEHLNPERLVDIQTVSIDPDLPPLDRLQDYLKQIKNPYSFRCSDIPVHISFDSRGKPLTDLLKDYFIQLKGF